MTHTLLLSQRRDYYGLKVLISILLMTLVLAYASFYLIQNYTANTFMLGGGQSKKIYFLKSYTLFGMYEQNGMDYEEYEKRLNYLKGICNNNGYKVETVYPNDLKGLDTTKSIVIAIDMMSLTSEEIAQTTAFVDGGGRILFNFTAGFLDSNLRYQEDNLVTAITPLRLNPKANTISYDRNSTGYMSVRLMSPMIEKLKTGKAYDLAIYDPLPLFVTPPSLQPDAYLTNWSQTNYMNIGSRELDAKESGLIWHGSKGKGKWVYFSFPSYVYVDAKGYAYSKIFESMVEYLNKDVSIVAYPYVDATNVMFLSEDTEYKFENLQQFSDVALKNKFPVTAFCVAELAQKFPQVMKYTAMNQYMEFGSHSYTHKQIVGQSNEVYKRETIGSKELLDKLTGRSIIGFRPPREEIDEKMLHLLDDGGFKYILNKGENRLTPYFQEDTLIIPRHGTDDYSYLVNLDWNSTQVLNEMQHQAKVLQRLNGIYTMSTHTHLMTFGPNIAIVDKFMQFVNAHKTMTPMNGEMIFNRAKQMHAFSYVYKMTPSKVILTLSNNGSEVIQNLHFEIEGTPNMKLTKVESEIIGFETQLTPLAHNKYTLTIKKIDPKSQVVLFVNYEKN